MAKENKSNKRDEPNYQVKYKDQLFVAIFGYNTEKSKRWRLQLYNALNGTDYSNPDELEVNTLDNVIYMKMHNDVSFLVDGHMSLYEHQSTYNPNMPLRGLFYFVQLYQKYITSNDLNILSEQPIRIPTPNFIVFYNGKKQTEERFKLRLSDSFMVKSDNEDFEWTAEVININQGNNLPLQKNCKAMYDYVSFVSRINSNIQNGMEKKSAIEEAVEWAIKENILEGFFKEQKEEVIGMCLTEWDEDEAHRVWKEDGRAEGARQKAIEAAENALKMELTAEQAAKISGLPLNQVLELQKHITVQA